MQWLIDIIKDWIETLHYATEAWVEAKLYLPKADYPGYGMPVNITGNPSLDCTCTYFRCGDLNGKPCYSQEDGSWFLWWNADTRWVISTALGLPLGRWGYRQDPNVLGAYTHFPHTSGDAVAAAGYKYLSTSYVNRGDPAVDDFALVDFTIDGLWHELDLSAIIPKYAQGADVTVRMLNTLVGRSISFRRHGQVNGINIAATSVQIAILTKRADLTISLDPDRKVDYMIPAGGWLFLFVTIKAWWF